MNYIKCPRGFFRITAFLLLTVLLVSFLLPAQAAGSDDPVNILLIGVDNKDLDHFARSDTMVLLRVDPLMGRVMALSFLRDLYVPIPEHGKNRLNAAYAFGGEELLKTTIQNQFDISIDYTVTVSFQLLAEVIDAMGGVSVDVLPNEINPLNKLLSSYNELIGVPSGEGHVTSSGVQTLTGAQALSYSRIRSIDNDFQRVVRQQTVLKGMMDRLKDMDFVTLVKIVFRCLGRVRTDMTLKDINALLPLANREDIEIETGRVPFDGMYTNQTINGMQVLVPDIDNNRTEIHLFLGIE